MRLGRVRARWWRTAAVAGAALIVAIAPGRVTLAQAATSVTLTASPTAVAPGESVALNGDIAPESSGQIVQVVDEEGAVLATASTDAEGHYATSFTPQATVTIQAAWQGVTSPTVRITVGTGFDLKLKLTGVRLFGTALVRGSISPAEAGVTVEVTLSGAGSAGLTRDSETNAKGKFTATFPIEEPGAYRARATIDGLPGAGRAGPRTTPLPSLHEGSRSVFVGLLEERLVDLHYRLVGVNEVFDQRTADAVLAFAKVQRMPRGSNVNDGVWRALADPRQPRPKSNARAFHVEVDQTRQVLYTVDEGEITNILHVSTGAGGATRDGAFRVHRKLAGYSANRLYYPSYFDGNRAIHGWPEVPNYPASHGCVRVPYWNAKWIFGLATYGTRVIVYH